MKMRARECAREKERARNGSKSENERESERHDGKKLTHEATSKLFLTIVSYTLHADSKIHSSIGIN